MSDETIMPFDFPAENPTIIKVIGVGGGGGNAVNHMYKEGIHDVTFVVCNTDNQALAESPVPVKLQLGKEGLGAGKSSSPVFVSTLLGGFSVTSFDSSTDRKSTRLNSSHSTSSRMPSSA